MKSSYGRPIYQPNKQRYITGERFNNLTALNFEYRDEKHNHYWKFRCDCGTEIVARKSAVTSGNTKQCKDCSTKGRSEKIKTHGFCGTRLYREWAGIIQRCENELNTSYNRYGAIGISVCEDWHKFEPFAEWALANGYSDELTIDRIDVNGNYEPSNCHATCKDYLDASKQRREELDRIRKFKDIERAITEVTKDYVRKNRFCK